MKQLLVCILGLGLGTACARDVERPADLDFHMPGARSEKPSAPVDVRLESRPVAGGYQLTLVATPMRDVAAVELSIARREGGIGQRISLGATAAGQRRELALRVTLAPGDGADYVGSAAVGTPGHMRNRVTSVHLGIAKAAAPVRVVTRTLPDGRRVAEVR